MDKDLPITNVKTLDQVLSDSVAPSRFSTTLLGIFCGNRSDPGLYGDLRSHVIRPLYSERTEIGVRMALGAQSRQSPFDGR